MASFCAVCLLPAFKRLQHFLFAGQEFLRQVEFLTVISRTVYDDLIFDLPRGSGHDIDPVRKQDRLINVMRDRKRTDSDIKDQDSRV